MFVPANYHPFNLPLPTEASSGNKIEELVQYVQEGDFQEDYRILITGGSAAFGLGSSAPEFSFPSQLEMILNEKYPDKNIRVFNGAVESFDSASELLLYLRFLRKLDPHLVIMFTGFNDLGHAVLLQLSPNPYKEIRKLKKIRYVNPLDFWILTKLLCRSFFGNIHKGMLKISRIYQVLSNFFGNMNPDEIEIMKERNEFKMGGAQKEIGSFLATVGAFHGVVQEQNSLFLLVFQPIRSCGMKTQGKIKTSWSDRRVRDLFYSYLLPRLGRFVSRKNIALLNLNGPFVDLLIEGNGFMDTVHLSDKGYHLSAQAVANHLNGTLGL